MFVISILILLALLFLLAELVLLPGLTVSGLLAMVCGGSAIYLAFADYGTWVGSIVTGVVLLLSLLTVVISLRSKTWSRLALRQQVDAAASKPLEEQVALGSRGVTLSRLSPMGTVEIEGRNYEAKLLTGYADPQTPIEVVGYENFSLIVKIIK